MDGRFHLKRGAVKILTFFGYTILMEQMKTQSKKILEYKIFIASIIHPYYLLFLFCRCAPA
ncbi:hypothetical protein FC814_21880 [Escherichia sp. MR]|nr:hypothetical protein FC814_21880 [Escherichia sp. MR]